MEIPITTLQLRRNNIELDIIENEKRLNLRLKATREHFRKALAYKEKIGMLKERLK